MNNEILNALDAARLARMLDLELAGPNLRDKVPLTEILSDVDIWRLRLVPLDFQNKSGTLTVATDDPASIDMPDELFLRLPTLKQLTMVVAPTFELEILMKGSFKDGEERGRALREEEEKLRVGKARKSCSSGSR